MTIEQNKETVRRLFEEAFRAGNPDALDDLMAPEYLQHSPMVGNGLEATKAAMRPMGPVDVEVHKIIAEGDLVAAHVHYKSWNMAAVEILRFNSDGKMIEHWDVLQPVP